MVKKTKVSCKGDSYIGREGCSSSNVMLLIVQKWQNAELMKRTIFRGDCYQHGSNNQLNLSASRIVAVDRVLKEILSQGIATLLVLVKD